MGKYLGLHEKSFIGVTKEISSAGSAELPSTNLVANPSQDGPARFVIMGSENFYILQNDGTAAVTANTGMRLQKFQPMVMSKISAC